MSNPYEQKAAEIIDAHRGDRYLYAMKQAIAAALKEAERGRCVAVIKAKARGSVCNICVDTFIEEIRSTQTETGDE